MNSTSNISTLTRWTNRVLIGLFVTLLWLPTLDTFFHIDYTPARAENRAMADFPKLQPGGRGLQAYLAGLEAWFNDHFGFRKCLVQWNNKLRWSLFKDVTTRSALVGKENWLYIKDGQMIEHYRGQLQFTPEQLHDWQVLLEKRRDWLARRGITYLFVVAPDKQTIYPENLPDWMTKIQPQTKLDQFFAYMRAHSTVPVLDLRPVLIEAKQTRPTYLKTDTHWNVFGGFVAYQELVRNLAKALPALKLEPAPITSFDVTNRLEPGGDLNKILGLSLTESNAYFLVPKPELPRFTVPLSTPENLTETKFTNNPRTRGRVIIFRDSFAENWIQFLGYNFNQVTYLFQNNLDPNRIAQNPSADIVVSEMVERVFNVEDPRQLLAEEAMN
jgi:hypothetical protein